MQSTINKLAKRISGFSLIEMMTVLVLLSILMGLAIPSYQSSVIRTKRAQAWGVMMKVMQQQERHYSMHGRYTDFSSITPRGFTWHSGNVAESSAYEIHGEACEDASWVQCVLVVAQPGTAKVQASYTDPECGTLSLDSSGVRKASGHGKSCW